MNIRQQIITILNTLNLIDVKGRDNMDRLLGSIIALERLLNGLSAPAGEDDGKGEKNEA